MQCHYDVLDVSRDASLEDLRKSYRKLVLQWHPDKNLNNTQECKEKFQLIQQAYDILSDPQERAWYDKHRDDILKGGENFKDNSLNVFQYFRTSCYSGFEDDEKGFFTVYRRAFEEIAAEDTPFMDQEELLPSFGNSASSYEEVVHLFYSHWQSYCTAKTYVWIEVYDIREASNRRVVRLMEKENKKLRDIAKKARNEEIRELVAFVRKRDPRVQAHKKKLEEKKAENQRKAQLQRQKAILERKQELSNYSECEWSNMSKLEAGLQELEAQLDNQFGRNSLSESGDETQENSLDGQDQQVDAEYYEEENSLYCIACDKVFQSERAKLNHDNSKKHRENVAFLKEVLQEEDNLSTKQQTDNDVSDSNEKEDLHHYQNKTEEDLQEQLLVSNSDSEVEQVKTKGKQSRSGKKKKKAVVIIHDESEDEEVELEDLQKNLENDKNVEEAAPSSTEMKEKKKRRRTKQSKPSSAPAAPATVEDTNDSETEPQKIICGTCKNLFPSRNKLFYHLKATKHSVYLEDKSKVIVSEKPVKGRKGKTKLRDI